MSAPAWTPAFAVRVESFLRVKPFVSKDATSYYLNGVAVQKSAEGGAVCVATDGHRLGVRRDAEGFSDRDVIVRVPRELKMPSARLFPMQLWLVCMEAGGKSHLSLVAPQKSEDHSAAEMAIAGVNDCITRWGDVVIDGTFPDWRRFLPAASKLPVLGLNGSYLKSFGNQLAIKVDNPAAPQLIKDITDPEFVGVLMPMRVDVPVDVPSWIKAS